MDKPLVSVIIPVYNSAEYLDRCLRSVTGQSHSELEIILIDDGSSDNSLEVIREYEKKDGRIKVIALERNMGQSTARNRGLDLARGEWMLFIDSDDEVEPDMAELLLDNALKNDADVCVGNYVIYNMADKTETVREVGSGVTGGREAFCRLVCEKKVMCLCSGIFRSGLFEKNRFPDGMVYEDSCMFARLLLDSGCCVCVNRTVYHYYQRPDGTALGSGVSKRMDQLRIMERICGYTAENAPEYSDHMYRYTLSVCLNLMDRVYPDKQVGGEDYWGILLGEFRKISDKIARHTFISAVETFLFGVSPVLVVKFRRLYVRLFS